VKESIVERELLVMEEGQPPQALLLSVGMPYWTREQEEAACPLSMRGYRDLETEIFGIDPMQALKLALEAIDILLEPLEAKLRWPDGTTY